MNFQIPKIYPITDARLSGLSHALQVEKLIAGGAQLIQLREKYATPREFFAFAETALKIARGHNVKIIINDRVDLAIALKADGVHLGQDDLPPVEARRLLGADAVIGFSTHNLDQATLAVKMPIDYLAIGPIYTTQTKENPDATVGLSGLREVRRLIGKFPLVAIGGINFQNIGEVFAAGADSAAVIGELVGQGEEISRRFQMLSNLTTS